MVGVWWLECGCSVVVRFVYMRVREWFMCGVWCVCGCVYGYV